MPIVGAHVVGDVKVDLSTLSLLNKGLKFVGTPDLVTADTLQGSINRFERSVRLRCGFGGNGTMPKFKVPNPSYVPKHAPPVVENFLGKFASAAERKFQALVAGRQGKCFNLTMCESKALRELRQRQDIVVKPADKNLGPTLMSKEAYSRSVHAHVDDPKVYVSIADVSKEVDRMCAQLRQLVNCYTPPLSEGEQEFFLQGLAMREVPHLYILPKLHKMKALKPPIVGRPIAACHSWITTNMSKFVADRLNGVLTQHNTILQDRTELIALLEQTEVTADTWLLTFDVESLYPNIDQTDCVNACAEALQGDSREKSMVADFLRFILENNFVQVEGEVSRQCSGGAMGTNCLPQAAQLYLAIKWEGVLKRKFGSRFPEVFKRFIDDGFVLFDGSEDELLAFIDALQNELPNINITYQYSQFEVEFLDLVIYKYGSPTASKKSLKVRTHQKALNKYLYIPYSSYHQPGMFSSFLNAELIRYVVTNSNPIWYNCMVEKFTYRLLQRGYPQSVIDSALGKVSYSDRPKYLQHLCHKEKDGNCAFVIPYAHGVADLQLQKLMHELYAGHPEVHAYMPKPIVCFRKNKNLGSWLVRAGA